MATQQIDVCADKRDASEHDRVTFLRLGEAQRDGAQRCDEHQFPFEEIGTRPLSVDELIAQLFHRRCEEGSTHKRVLLASSDAPSLCGLRVAAETIPGRKPLQSARPALSRPASAASSSRLSALAIAVARSSVNSARRSSVSTGNGVALLEITAAIPQTSRSTMTGAETDERQPSSRTLAAAGPATPS
jgi:hypothetical protein